MAWFMEISERAENLLNSLDKSAAIAFNTKQQKGAKNANYCDAFHDPSAAENPKKLLTNELSTPSTSKQSVSEEVYSSVTENIVTSSFSKPSPEVDALGPENQQLQLTVSTTHEKLQNEILQNEIHSLNNEISLLLNRAKIAEQKSIELTERLATAERKNFTLEEQLSSYILDAHTTQDKLTSLPNGASDFSITFKETNKKPENGGGNSLYEHYDSQIEELLQEKTTLEETLKSKNDEVMMLKSRLNQKGAGFSNEDLNSRLRALTITLVEKQSALDRMILDKNSLSLKYDQLQRKYDEVLTRVHQRININDTDDVKAQTPVYKSEKPYYGTGIKYRLRNAYSSLNSLGVNTDLLFRRYPYMKTFLWIYMISMHFLIFLLLSSHVPDSTSV